MSSDLKETVKKTLQEYETTLKNQSTHIQQLEGEREMIHSHNEELEQKCNDLEFRLNRVTVSRDALSTRIEELTQSMDGKFIMSSDLFMIHDQNFGVLRSTSEH